MPYPENSDHMIRGFALAEVLVALAVFTIFFFVVGLRLSNRSRETRPAMERLRGELTWLHGGDCLEIQENGARQLTVRITKNNRTFEIRLTDVRAEARIENQSLGAPPAKVCVLEGRSGLYAPPAGLYDRDICFVPEVGGGLPVCLTAIGTVKILQPGG